MIYLILSILICILATVLWIMYKKNGNLQKLQQQILQEHEKQMNETAITYEEKEQLLLSNFDQIQYGAQKVHQKELEQYKNKSEIELNKLSTDYQKKLAQSEQNHLEKVNDLEEQIYGLKKQVRNTGEVATHQILREWKKSCIRRGVLKEEEFHIIPNIFIPNDSKKGERTNRQVDHLLLSRTGIYVLETKYWQGTVVHGLSKEDAGVFSFLLEGMKQKGNGQNDERTIVFVPKIIDDESGNIKKIIQIHSYGEPVSQAKSTAYVTKIYLADQTNMSNLYVTPVVYFGYPQKDEKMNGFLDFSNSDVQRLSTKQELESFLDRENQKEKRFTVVQLQQFKEIIENANYI
ncbi:NERD domain-containing protein [Priestia megaterium]|uniref:nuclease-related domain-containing protein n=1 Tax=Priestia megaterium TaxID=1404 RepID=UPI0021AC7AE5|nr:nuclease-related domain-containing protein [Priestia megaterium]MCR8927462.1 NERD domain-containing protein [Priestia megaterium]